MRITNQVIVDRVLLQIAQTQRKLTETQSRIGSGLRVSRPSDDPYAASRIMAARTSLERTQQYDRNASMALSDLGATEAALTNLTGVLQRAAELAVQAANGTLSAAERSAIALEVGALVTQAITVGNTNHAGNYIFAGQKTDTVPYVPDIPNNPTTVTYNGDTGLIQREILEGTRLSVNITGDRVLPGVFAALISFRDDLLANDQVALDADGAALDTQLEAVLNLRGETGAKIRRTEMTQTHLQDDTARIRALLSQIEDADLTQTIVELQAHEVAYQAALGAASRTLGLNLLDFLR